MAVVNTQLLLSEMPDTKAAQKDLEALQKEYEDAIEAMKQELQKKYEEYVAKQDTYIETIKLRKQQEIEDLNKRITDLVRTAEQELMQKQQKLMAPIQQKLKDAINKVGAENGFAYILDAQVMIYIGSTGVDATDLIRVKLGLKK
ncbi:OmpH family outer membrane protein [Porphyromonas sp.]|uniref:OmpH family outer membrane protein n=1 Tax=Porphyromonas sp. TaxID=1924944 RepID=UPI0026DBADC4|nr:OmpH family outer membrane protein [Porphyromonas sp.]MDO4770942.1 OmpH family outer membrane protein [Porphyromonas sp.]